MLLYGLAITAQTEVIAKGVVVDENNEPFRKPDGSILFRPGGHGALIENLDEITSSIVFIKNIDNVAKESLLPETVKWKKVLGGELIKVQ